jgi:L-rhamnose isomerase
MESPYAWARREYAQLDIDSEAAIKNALSIPISIHCWQADDVKGLEKRESPGDGGGILATGGYPGTARTGVEIRSDLDAVLDVLPGAHRLNLHAFYAETDGAKADRDKLGPEHFAKWISWAKQRRIGLDFNPTYFAHPMAADGQTLSHPDKTVRAFWIAHGRACRRIAAAMAKALKSPVVLNHWVPDGSKDMPADRWSPRERLADSLDRIIRAKDPKIPKSSCLDAVEGKLFGLGSEAYVVGSHEFYLQYALTREVMLCLDMGHFHPTETIDDKLSAVLTFQKEVLLHVSRPMRWDSDHVVVFDDALRNVFLEIGRAKAWPRVRVALDYFDASINRLAAYVIGVRATRQAILYAMLDPTKTLRNEESAGRHAQRLAWMEAAKTLPFGLVWDELCDRARMPRGAEWLPLIEAHEERILKTRG